MEEIRIPNSATYAPVSLLELGLTAPLLSRFLLGATLPGRLLQTASLALYAGSAAQDWVERLGVRRLDFTRVFGVDIRRLPRVSRAAREQDIARLVARLDEAYTPGSMTREALARSVDDRLTELIARHTGQRVLTSTEVRSFSLTGLVFPFALGATDILSGDVAILRDLGPFEPHVVAHELAHRKGYWKELHAQLLAYYALIDSDEPILVQSALCERLLRQLSALSVREPHRLHRRIEDLGLRPELQRWFLALRPEPGLLEEAIAAPLKAVYDARMRLTGQNGLSDYDEGFTAALMAREGVA